MIDMHIHSICSDGSDELDVLIDNLKQSGVKCFALTDHDTAEGCRRFLSDEKLITKLKDESIEFITGIEWSCIYKGEKMHILAYGFDPFNENVLKLELEMRAMLNEIDKIRIDSLEEMGFILSEKSKNYLSEKENVRTLDFAKCLVDDGYFDDIQDAAKTVSKVKYDIQTKFDADYLITQMAAVGAKIAWAHPIYDIRRKYRSIEKVEEIIQELFPIGLTGLECYYSLYNENEIKELLNLASKYGLFVTCGSDYHGKNKNVMPLVFSSDGYMVDNDVIIEKEKLL